MSSCAVPLPHRQRVLRVSRGAGSTARRRACLRIRHRNMIGMSSFGERDLPRSSRVCRSLSPHRGWSGRCCVLPAAREPKEAAAVQRLWMVNRCRRGAQMEKVDSPSRRSQWRSSSEGIDGRILLLPGVCWKLKLNPSPIRSTSEACDSLLSLEASCWQRRTACLPNSSMSTYSLKCLKSLHTVF